MMYLLLFYDNLFMFSDSLTLRGSSFIMHSMRLLCMWLLRDFKELY